jgi:hypothetical protein
MEQEAAFLGVIAQVAVFTCGDGSLELRDSAGAVLVRLARQTQAV